MPVSPEKIFSVNKNHSGFFPLFYEPKIVGYWSLDGSRQIHWDSSQLRYYTPFKQPNVEYDLNEGASVFERTPECLDDEKCEHILRWLQRNYAFLLDNQRSDKWLQPDFILQHRMFSAIVKSPYQPADDWTICAAKWRGTIYLCQFETDVRKFNIENLTEDDKKKWAWPHKFKQYMLTETPGGEPDTSRAVKESEGFHCVYQTRLNNHHLLYVGEMGGLCSDEKFEDPLPLDRLKFVELKTDSLYPTRKQESNFKRYKSLDWWAQGYLNGATDIVCGLRDHYEGVVRRLESTRVFDLQENFKGFWNAAVCMNFGDEFLNFVKHIVENEYDQTIYKFERKVFGDIIVTELEPTSENAFLPDWFIQLAEV